MKKIFQTLITLIAFLVIQNLAGDKIFCQFILQQDSLKANNIKNFIWNDGTIDQDLYHINNAGFEWMIGTGKKAIFTTGLCIAGYVNNQIRTATAFYGGHFRSGYCVDTNYYVDSRFHFYKIRRGDNWVNNPDWLNWGLMTPFGAPFIDINNNGAYEYYIDTPGVKSASETIFICLTDADSSSHSSSRGFGGGTRPLYTEVHMTAWCYDNPGYQDMNFFKWVVRNKSTFSWDSVIISLVSDVDLGDAGDDYIGCDSTRNLGYCYNADDSDLSYGLHPPAVGFIFLNCSSATSRLTSFCKVGKNNGPISCEGDPYDPNQAFNYMMGFKRDRTPWVIPNSNPPQTTKFCYSGDPETNSGWTEYTGSVQNCGGSLTGNLISPTYPGDRRLLLNYVPVNRRLNPGDSQTVLMSHVIARGSNNKNSVTLLKQLATVAQNLCNNGFVIGINQISTEIPKQFSLVQNYPNPFNPNTVISFQLTVSSFVSLKVYDVLGREVTTLVNEKLKAGTFKVDWDGAGFANGVYFYSLVTDNFSQTKKMVLMK